MKNCGRKQKYIDEIPCKKKSLVVNNLKDKFIVSNRVFILRVNLYLQLPIKKMED